MNLPKRIQAMAVGLAVLIGLVSVGLAGGPGKPFSHKFHLEQGAECSTCHKIVKDKPLPVLDLKGCQECHEEGPPAWTYPNKAKLLPFPFPHKLHAGDFDCSDCHKPVMQDAEKAGQPLLDYQKCQACHKDNDVEVNRCQQCHGKDFKLPNRPLKIPFPHKLHAAKLPCDTCHKHGQPRPPADQPLLDQADCVACHAERHVELPPGRCAPCHGVDERKVPPPDHARAWLREHGEASHWRKFDRHGRDCKLCHRGDGCQTCHKTMRPTNHTGLWRTRTHGVAADWDRETCRTCHETGACIRCHLSNPPLNHKGAWRATHGLAAQSVSNEHCAVCHQLSWCAACHRGR